MRSTTLKEVLSGVFAERLNRVRAEPLTRADQCPPLHALARLLEDGSGGSKLDHIRSCPHCLKIIALHRLLGQAQWKRPFSFADSRVERDSNPRLVSIRQFANSLFELPVSQKVAMVGGILAALFVATIVQSALRSRLVTTTPVTWNTALTRDPSLSPGAESIAYASALSGRGDLDIWLENIPVSRRVRLTSDPADDYSPSLSHGLVAFRSDRASGASGRAMSGGIYVVSTAGGPERLIAPGGYNPKLSPDGKWIAYWTGEPMFDQSQLYAIPSRGGEATDLCPTCYSAKNELWSSDGTALLYSGAVLGTNGQTGPVDWWVLPIEQGHPRQAPIRTFALSRLGAAGIEGKAKPEAWDGNRIYFSVSGPTSGIWKIAIANRTFQITGDPTQVTRGGESYGALSVGGPGTLYYSVLHKRSDVWALSGDTHNGTSFAPVKAITSDEATDTFPSAASGKLVFASDRGGRRAIWMKDLSTASERVLAWSDTFYDSPKLSPDGNSVAYGSYDALTKIWALKIVQTSGATSPVVFPGCGPPAAWSPDGKSILFASEDSAPTKPYGAGILNVTTRRKRFFETSEFSIFPNGFSPDGKWVFFHTRLGSRRNVWRTPLEAEGFGEGHKWRKAIADPSDEDMQAQLDPTGGVLYFLSDRDGHRCVWAQRLDAELRPINRPFPINHFHEAAFSLREVGSPGQVGLTLEGKTIFLSVAQNTGNIWLLRSPENTQLALPFVGH